MVNSKILPQKEKKHFKFSLIFIKNSYNSEKKVGIVKIFSTQKREIRELINMPLKGCSDGRSFENTIRV